MRPDLTLFLVSLTTAVAAYNCTEGVSWTPDEFAEYLTLNDTTGWAPMQRIQHCQVDESDFEDPHANMLEARGGGNYVVVYSGEECYSGDYIQAVEDFGCGGCWSTNVNIKSGRLWRETTGNPYPTVDYYSGINCEGTKIHHQGIYSGQHESCDDINSARSFVVYQGC